MKIKFSLFQVLLLIIVIFAIYHLGPIYYDAWINPKYDEYGNLFKNIFFIRVIGTTIIILPVFIYLITTDARILTKKREINLTPWKSTN